MEFEESYDAFPLDPADSRHYGDFDLGMLVDPMDCYEPQESSSLGASEMSPAFPVSCDLHESGALDMDQGWDDTLGSSGGFSSSSPCSSPVKDSFSPDKEEEEEQFETDRFSEARGAWTIAHGGPLSRLYADETFPDKLPGERGYIAPKKAAGERKPKTTASAFFISLPASPAPALTVFLVAASLKQGCAIVQKDIHAIAFDVWDVKLLYATMLNMEIGNLRYYTAEALHRDLSAWILDFPQLGRAARRRPASSSSLKVELNSFTATRFYAIYGALAELGTCEFIPTR